MSLQAFVDWISAKALPFWLRRGCSDEGLFFEAMHLDAVPVLAAELRLRTGMRQVHAFCQAVHLGLVPRDPYVAHAQKLLDGIRAIAWAPDGRRGWVARFERDGKVLDSRHDLDDHAFVLNALGSLYQVTGEARYLAWIDDALKVIDQGMNGLHGGWAESTAAELPRRQSPHMHFFAANLTLYETTGEARHLARAGELFGLFRSRFLDQETGVLREFFGPEWQVAPNYRSERLKPGHMMEWVWLLRRFSRSTGRMVEGYSATLMETALQVGLHASGFLVDEADMSGHPLSNTRRFWPQVEYMKALVVQAGATQKPQLIWQAEGLSRRLFASYLADAPDGCWRDQFTLDGTMISDTIPSGSLYNLVAAAGEILLSQRRA